MPDQVGTPQMDANIQKLFLRIHEEVVNLFYCWKIYRQLFVSGEENLALLNRSGSNVFALLQSLIQENVLLTLCRLTDPEKTGAYENLSMRNILGKLEAAISVDVQADLRERLEMLGAATGKLRTHRSKRIAHLDLTHATNPELLPPVYFAEVEEALSLLEAIMRSVHLSVLNADTRYKEPNIAYGCDGIFLLSVLKEAHKPQEGLSSTQDVVICKS